MDATTLRLALILLGALGSGLIAGVFYGFSTFVMKALAKIPPAQGLSAMQSINVVVLNFWFLGAFMGTAAISVGLLVWSFIPWTEGTSPLLLAGSLLYLLGCFVVTAAANVPRNDALAKLAPDEPEAEGAWRRYVSSWTAWNHVRTAASLLAALLFTLALAAAAR